MTGIIEDAKTAVARLICDKCGEIWWSSLYEPVRWGDEVKACAPAWPLGWRVYVAGRGHRTYCPSHEPSVPMRVLFGNQEIGGRDA